jgi:hypothetical protein
MFTEDLGAFFADFGISVVFKNGATTVATATMIFDAPTSEILVHDRSFYDAKFYEAKAQGQAVSLHGSQADIANVAVGFKATPTGQGDWYVIAIEPDGTGLVTIHLSGNTP